MKPRSIALFVAIATSAIFYSCDKSQLFKSEKEVKNELQGTWDLYPIPRYDYYNGDSTIHVETWTFDDTKVTILNSAQINNGQTATSTYSVHTSFSKAEFTLDGVTPEFTFPARIRNINATWRIIRLDDEFLVIANDMDGNSGLTELEFKKK